VNPVRLSECCEIVSGATPKSAVPEFWDGDVDWATPADLSGLSGAYIHSTPRKLTLAGLASCSSTVLPPGSVLFSSRAPIGHVAINTAPMATNQGFKSLIPNAGILDAKYLYHWLRGNKTYLQSLGNGATFKEVSKATVARIEIPLPPIYEQRRIAAILDQADDLRVKRHQALAQLDNLTLSIFLDMFGDPDMAVRGGNYRFLPEVVAELQGGKNLVASDPNLDARNRVLKISAVTGFRYRPAESKPLPNEYSPPRSHFVRPGDLLISRANTTDLVGAVALVEETPTNLVLPDKLWRFVWRDPENVDPTYVWALLQTPAMRRELSARSSGTGGSMKNISKAKLATLRLPWPDVEEQHKFAARMSARAAIARVYEGPALDALFESLQSRAFSGRL